MLNAQVQSLQHRMLPLMPAIADEEADPAEDPVDVHRDPDAHQPEMEEVLDDVRGDDAEDPHGEQGDFHRVDHVAGAAHGVADGECPDPEQDRHHVVGPADGDRQRLRRLCQGERLRYFPYLLF